jgi:Kef-type K+ transport system membrane component KefB
MTYIPSWGPDFAATMPLKTFPAELGIIWLAFRMSLEFDPKKNFKVQFLAHPKKLLFEILSKLFSMFAKSKGSFKR